MGKGCRRGEGAAKRQVEQAKRQVEQAKRQVEQAKRQVEQCVQVTWVAGDISSKLL